MSEAKEIRIGGGNNRKDNWDLDNNNQNGNQQSTIPTIRTTQPATQPMSMNLGTATGNEQPGVSSPEHAQQAPQQEYAEESSPTVPDEPAFRSNYETRPPRNNQQGQNPGGQQRAPQNNNQQNRNNGNGGYNNQNRNFNQGGQQRPQQNNNRNQNGGKKDQENSNATPVLVKADPNHYFGYVENDTSIGYQPNDNKFGLEPIGSAFTVTEKDIADWFTNYFDHYGYKGVMFGFGNSPHRRENGIALPSMFLMIPRHGNILKTGMSASDTEQVLLGYKNNGGNVRLDNTFRNLVKRFLWFYDRDKKKLFLKDRIVLTKSHPNWGYLEVNPDDVLLYNFCANNMYDVVVSECNCESATSRKDIYIGILRIKKAKNPRGNEAFEALEFGKRMY